MNGVYTYFIINFNYTTAYRYILLHKTNKLITYFITTRLRTNTINDCSRKAVSSRIYFGLQVCHWCHTRLGHREVNKGRAMRITSWPPPRSPGQTSWTYLDFISWGHVRKHLFAEKVQDINHFKQQLNALCGNITTDMFWPGHRTRSITVWTCALPQTGR